MASYPSVCPVCQRNDDIRKLAAIVSSQSYYGTSSAHLGDDWSPTTIRHESRSPLAAQLAPPRKPTSRWNGFLSIIMILIGTIFALAGINPYSSSILITPLIISVLLILPAIAIPVYLLLSVPQWKRKIQIWQTLYYCSRDNIVFGIEGGKHFSPNQMKQYLNHMAEDM